MPMKMFAVPISPHSQHVSFPTSPVVLSSPSPIGDEGSDDSLFCALASGDLVPASSSPTYSSPPAAVTPPDRQSTQVFCAPYTQSLQSAHLMSSAGFDMSVLQKESHIATQTNESDPGSLVEAKEDPTPSVRSRTLLSDEGDLSLDLELPSFSTPQSPFLGRLHQLLLVVQKERQEAEFRRLLSNGIRPHSSHLRSAPTYDATSRSLGISVTSSASETVSAAKDSSSSSGDVSDSICLSTANCDILPSLSHAAQITRSEYCSKRASPYYNVGSGLSHRCDLSDPRSDSAEQWSCHPPPTLPDRNLTVLPPNTSFKLDCMSKDTVSRAYTQDPRNRMSKSDREESNSQDSLSSKRRGSDIEVSEACERSTGIETCTQTATRDCPVAEPLRKRRKMHCVESRFFTRKPSLKIAALVDANTQDHREPGNKSKVSQRACTKRAAILRRATSLRADISQQFPSETVQGMSEEICPSSQNSVELYEVSSTGSGAYSPTPFSPHAYIPTVPVSRSTTPQRLSPVPIPILAPPSFEHIPRAPLSVEDAAEARISMMLAKERAERESDGLVNKTIGAGSAARMILKDTELETRHKGDAISPIICEIEEWVDSVDEYDCCDSDQRSVSQLSEDTNNVPKSIFLAKEPFMLGIVENSRMEVIDWILDVLPAEIPSRTCRHRDLHEQLSRSDVTRFHAAYLFTRFFLHIGRSRTSSPAARKTYEDRLGDEGKEAIIWDLAVACLALSVKFHRDVFLPLYSIPAHEFISLAPHSMSYDNLETAQRDILDTLSFSIGSVTPEAYFQELWHALASLRAVLNFENGWKVAQEQAWGVLLEALMQPDILRFPVSLLAATALVDGVIESLIQKYQLDVFVRTGHKSKTSQLGGIRRKAENATRMIQLDVGELLGYSNEDLSVCRRWLLSTP